MAVQGLGHVGWCLCGLLRDAGAQLLVTDIAADTVQRAVDQFGAVAVAPDAIYAAEADIFAPCAIGGILNADTIPQLQVQVVAGGANNQLATAADAAALHERGILYAPDFVANGGGIINVATEILRISDRQGFVDERLAALQSTLTAIFQQAEADNTSPDAVAIATVLAKMADKAA